MKNRNATKIIYSINISDIQEVSQQVLDRPLNANEIVSVQGSVGDYLDWFQAIENAIRENVHE
jgi:hypothetical protein